MPPVQPTTATLLLSVSGTLSADSLIGGVDITVSLPSGVTAQSSASPPLTDSGVAVPSGAASGATLMATYTPVSGGTSAAVRVLLADANGFAAGDVAIVNCDITPGSSPREDQFAVTAVQVKDLNGAIIQGMTAVVTATIQ
jgi:hypothetical protein